MENRDMLLRSMLYVPGNNVKFLKKAVTCDADALILDLEDSVPESERKTARNNIVDYISSGRYKGRIVFVRINELGTKDFVEDMKSVAIEGVTGFMPTKIKTTEDIVFIDRLLSLIEIDRGLEDGYFILAPLIETVEAVNNVEDIAKSSTRLRALCFGGEDYLNDLQSTYIHFGSAIEYPRHKIVNACRANGLLPIDTPYLELKDYEGYCREEREMYKIGFAGNELVNPGQIEYANRCFSPTCEEIEFSERIIEASERAKNEKNSGIAVYEGKMIGPPMIKRARTVLHLRDLINNRNS